MQLLEVTSAEYSNAIHPALCFNKPEFNELNKTKVEKIRYFLFKDSKIRFGLCVGQRGNQFLCPFSAPFGTFVNAKEKWDINQLEEAIIAFDKFAAENKLDVDFILPPEFYAPEIVGTMQNVLWRQGYDYSNVELNFQLDLHRVHTPGYRELLPHNGRKNLAIALESGCTLRHCESIEEKKRAYEIIAINRQSRGYPLNMTWEQVKNTIAIVEHDMFIVNHRNEEIAAALVYHISDKILEVIYWGDKPGFAELKPINFLSYNLIQYYGGRGFEYLDIGISTDHSIINYGLADFKRSIGCGISTKMSFVKKSGDIQCSENISGTVASGTFSHNEKYLKNHGGGDRCRVIFVLNTVASSQEWRVAA